MHQQYDGPERRTVSKYEVADMVAEELDTRLAETETNLINHINVKMGQFEVSMASKITEIVNSAIDKHIEEAFPPGPLHKHKDQHQKYIDAAGFWKKVVQDLQMWALRGILLFFFGILLLGAKEWLVRELAK